VKRKLKLPTELGITIRRIISNAWNYTATDEPQPYGSTWIKEKLITTTGVIILQMDEGDWAAYSRERYINPISYITDRWNEMKRETRQRLFPATIGYPESESISVTPWGGGRGVYQLWP